MTEDRAKFSAERHADGRFISTGGRPIGTKNKLTKRSTRAITDLHDLAFLKLAELLNAGHPATVEFVVRNLLPTGGRAVQLDDLSASGLTEAIAEGAVSPSEAKSLASTIAALKSIAEIDAIAERLAALEKLAGSDDA